MKFIAKIYGINIYADTEDMRKFELVNKFLEENCMPKLPTDEDIEKEVTELINK